jgi:Tn3 transposase DDE domain
MGVNTAQREDQAVSGHGKRSAGLGTNGGVEVGDERKVAIGQARGGDDPARAFLARYLRDRDLQRETESALNVVENYSGVNDYIRFGKRGELASNRKEEQELGMLCLHILQSALGYINTLMIQDTVALPEWQDVLTDADQRGLTPIFHTIQEAPGAEHHHPAPAAP